MTISVIETTPGYGSATVFRREVESADWRETIAMARYIASTMVKLDTVRPEPWGSWYTVFDRGEINSSYRKGME